MDQQIELTYKFLNLNQIHPAKAHLFYIENQDAIDWVLDTWKKHRDELIKIKDKKSFYEALKKKMIKY